MANGLFNLKQVMQGIQQGGWVNQVGASTYGAYFGGSGSGQYLLGPTTSALNFSTGSFTVEFWAFISAYGGGDLTIMFSASNASADFQFGASASSGVYWHNSGNQLTSNATAVPLGKWVHMALVRSGTTASLFCNGIRYSTATNSAAVNLTNFNIGSYQGAPSAYMTKGWISNLRITNTAVYDPTATTLTLPLSNLTAISGTQLLTLQNATIVDNSTNALTITNNGSVAMQTVTPFGLSNYKPPAVEYLVVAGGGGGWLAAGGAGGLLTGIDPVPNGQTLLVTVGAGGAIGTANGNNSVFGNITATGGGHGSDNSGTPAASGGSGGAGYNTNGAGIGVSGQGNAGASGTSSNSGGGGGAATAGTPGISTGVGGAGGAGVSSAISGTVTAYAGGGGGSGSSTGGPGGVGGGGNGSGAAQGTDGTANTGGGGGGDLIIGGKSGGSGIVIISYPDTYAAASAVTGATVSTSGSGSIYNAGTGTVQFTGTATPFTFSGDFTIEGWYNLANFNNAAGGGNPALVSSGSTSNWLVAIPGGTYVFYSGGSLVLQTSAVASANTWNHFAVVRSGTTVTIYHNGTSVGTATLATTVTGASTTTVTANGTGGVGSVTGYMSNVRIVKGTAVYTGAFTPSTIPLTAITNTQLLMNAMSGSYLVDGSTNSFTPTSSSTSLAWNASSPFTVTGYKNRVYTWTSSGSITF